MRSIWLIVLLAVSGVGCTNISEHRQPACEPGSATTLMAESVMTAELIPCVRFLPVGWEFGAFEADEDSAMFLLEARSGDEGSVEVELLPGCVRPNAGRSVTSDEAGAALTREISSRTPYRATWTYEFTGGCTRYRIVLTPEPGSTDNLGQLRRSLSFLTRGELAENLAEQGA